MSYLLESILKITKARIKNDQNIANMDMIFCCPTSVAALCGCLGLGILGGERHGARGRVVGVAVVYTGGSSVRIPQ